MKKTYREILSLVENAMAGSVSAGSIASTESPPKKSNGERPSRKMRRKGSKNNAKTIFV